MTKRVAGRGFGTFRIIRFESSCYMVPINRNIMKHYGFIEMNILCYAIAMFNFFVGVFVTNITNKVDYG